MSARAPSKPTPTTDDTTPLLTRVAEGEAPDTTDTPLRWAAYTTRIRAALTSAHRYVAYTSDIGESFRPVAHPWLVRSAYGISWLYISGDVASEAYKAYVSNHQSAVAPPPFLDDWRTVAAQRLLFQSIASMGLPAVTIHSVVRYSGRALKGVKNVRVRTWAPIGLGLGVVPLLPWLFDHPVETAVEWGVEKGYEVVTGKKGTRKVMVKEKDL